MQIDREKVAEQLLWSMARRLVVKTWMHWVSPPLHRHGRRGGQGRCTAARKADRDKFFYGFLSFSASLNTLVGAEVGRAPHGEMMFKVMQFGA